MQHAPQPVLQAINAIGSMKLYLLQDTEWSNQLKLLGMKSEYPISIVTMKAWLPDLFKLMHQAGDAILVVYRQDFTIHSKDDKSPVTAADIRSGEIITAGLRKLTPDIMVVSEEAVEQPYAERKTQPYIWMLDPLDGTKEFVKRNDEFSICLALIHHGEPILGLIYAPVTGDLYYGIRSEGSYKRTPDGRLVHLPIPISMEQDVIRVVTSKSHRSEGDEKYIQQLRDGSIPVEILAVGSALKFCSLAEGTADVYPKFGITMEWDIAAGKIILEEAGGKMLEIDGLTPLVFNKEDLRNPFFVARSGSSFRAG